MSAPMSVSSAFSPAVFTARLLLLALALIWVQACDRNDSAGSASRGAGDGHVAGVSSPGNGPGGFTGVFHRNVDGTRSVLNLTERGGKLSGMLDAANITAEVSGDQAHGEVRDPGTAAKLGTVDLSLKGDSLVLTLKAIDPHGRQGAETLQLPAVTYTRGAPPPIDVQLDAQLTGRWRHTWAGASSAPGAATTAVGLSAELAASPGGNTPSVEIWLILHPDGAIEHGKRRSADDSAIETSGDEGISGKWRTSEALLHVLPAGRSHWVPFARYHVEGDKLLLIYNDGSRQLFFRQ